MKTIAVTVHVPISTLAEKLTPEISRMIEGRAKPKLPPAPTAKLRDDLGSPDVAQAIQAVVQATNRLDRDQFTHGEQSAVTALFEAAKRLRTATRRI